MLKWFHMVFNRHSKLSSSQKQPTVTKNNNLFSPEEATFLISKLRQANYQGTEFETFYQIMSKLTKLAEK